MVVSFFIFFILAALPNLFECVVIQGDSGILNHHHHQHHPAKQTVYTHQQQGVLANRQLDEDSLLHAQQICSMTTGRFLPCACRPKLTTTKIHADGKVVRVQFPEFLCDEATNRKRKRDGFIAEQYKCIQLTGRRILYTDIWNRPIEEEIRYRDGCELRCVNKFCHGPYGNSTGQPGRGITGRANKKTELVITG